MAVETEVIFPGNVTGQELSRVMWGAQTLLAEVVEHDYGNFDRAAAREYALLDDPMRFIDSRLEPNTEVGRSKREDQRFFEPVVAVARDEGRVVAYAHAMKNVSGRAVERVFKRIKHPENVYVVVNDLAVHPDYRGQDLGSKVAYAAVDRVQRGTEAQYGTSKQAESKWKHPISVHLLQGSKALTQLVQKAGLSPAPGASLETNHLPESDATYHTLWHVGRDPMMIKARIGQGLTR